MGIKKRPNQRIGPFDGGKEDANGKTNQKGKEHSRKDNGKGFTHHLPVTQKTDKKEQPAKKSAFAVTIHQSAAAIGHGKNQDPPRNCVKSAVKGPNKDTNETLEGDEEFSIMNVDITDKSIDGLSHIDAKVRKRCEIIDHKGSFPS